MRSSDIRQPALSLFFWLCGGKIWLWSRLCAEGKLCLTVYLPYFWRLVVHASLFSLILHGSCCPEVFPKRRKEVMLRRHDKFVQWDGMKVLCSAPFAWHDVFGLNQILCLHWRDWELGKESNYYAAPLFIWNGLFLRFNS